jgi:hypothetical protein
MAHHRDPKNNDEWTPPTFGTGVLLGLIGAIIVMAIMSMVMTGSWALPLG